MRFPLTLLGIAAQVPLKLETSHHPLHTGINTKMAATAEPGFAFKEGKDIFSPKDLVSVQL